MWSGLSSYFGGGGARKDTAKNAIVNIRAQLELLGKREKHLESQIEAQNVIAKKNVTTNKAAAMAALKRKKMYEKALTTTQDQMGTLESQVYAIEEAKINTETIKAMQEASKAMKSVQQGINVDKIDKIVSEVEEQKMVANEITDAMTRINADSELDMDELEDELNQIQQAAIDEKMTGVSAPISEPAGSSQVAVTPQLEEEDEEAELRKLQAEMAV